MKKKTRKTELMIVVFLAAAFVAVSPFLSFAQKRGASALTSSTVGAAVKAGGGAELWDADSGDFNGEVMDDLLEKLFGNADPVEYIKTMKDTQTDSYVIPASTINEKVGNAANGLVVKLGSKDWMAASLTLADIDDNEDNVILTLYLANDAGTSQYYTNNTNTKGNNMYSRSTVRNHLLTNANWALFQDKGEESFAQQFLVQPKYIKYQQTETHVGRANAPFNYNCPNDALGALSSGWYSGINYQPGDTYDGKRYDAWGEDYIWLPSATETGYQNYLQTSSVWKLSAAQLAHNGASYSWLRSGSYNYYSYAYLLQTSGAYGSNFVSNTYGVRPALHLNLSSAALGAAGATLKNPEDVSTTYNGDVQTPKSAYEANPKNVGWYSKKWYDADGYIAVTPSAQMKDAGTYWVKVELQQKWFDDTNAKIEIDAAANGWTAEQKAAAKEKRTPKFQGTPDVSDSAHAESDRIRWFRFTITPKAVTVTKPAYDSGTGVFTAPKFADETEFYDTPPVLATKFTGTAANGTAYSAIDVFPVKRGNYTAQAILVKSAADKTEYTGNYVIKDAANATCAVALTNRSRLAIPSTAETTKAYAGSKLTFALSGYSAEWTDTGVLTLPDGMTLEGSDAEGWKLCVTDAGDYTVTAAIKQSEKADWCWNTANASEEVVADRTFTLTVTRKTLTVDFTSTTGAFMVAAGAAVSFAAEPANALTGDDVTLTLEYYNGNNPSAKIPVPSGRLDASELTPGTYRLVATLNDAAAAGNKNYKIDGGKAEQEFTVNAKSITVTSVNWQYAQNNGAQTAVTGGTASSAPFAVTYNGSAYVFSIITASLADGGVKVDASYATNGYSNGAQTNATSGAVAVAVRLIPFDDSYMFLDASGKPLAQQYKDFTLYVKVNKADIDFSEVVWSTDELEYNAVNQSVSIVSGLPAFLSATYSAGATGRNIGSYTAKVTGFSITDQAAAANYNVPSSSQISANEKLTHAWAIVRKRIEIVWITTEQTQAGNVIFVPSIADNSAGAVEYEYYNADKTQKMTLEEIFADYDATQMKDYYVCAKLKASGGSYNAANCVLVEGGEEVTESYQGFQAGMNKTPVRIGLKVNKATYNKLQQPAEIEFEGGNLSAEDFTLTYTKDGASCGVPVNAGAYKVRVELVHHLSDSHAITGQCEFDYVIEKADYDVSAMKWVDTEHENAEYAGPYAYAPNLSHTLSFVGENIAGLTVGYTAATEGNLQGENAGDYRVEVTFEVADPENYNVPRNIEFTWTIDPCTPDLSGVTWNYSTESPFCFTVTDGVAVKYSVSLTGLPEGLEELIDYTGHTAEYSDAGSYVTSFSVKESDPKRGNWGELVFAAGLDSRLVWEIKTKTADKAAQRQTYPFRDGGYSFAEITALPDDFAEYFDVQVKDSANDDLAQTGGVWTFTDADQYRVLISFKQGMNKNNGGSADNVKWSDNARGSYQIILKIDKLVFDVNGWIDGTENGRAELDAAQTEEIETYFDYVLTNWETGANVALNAVLEYETVYTIALKLKDGYSGNVAVKYLGYEAEETAPYAFQTEVDPLAPPPESYFRKPSGAELYFEYRYTGAPIDFTLGGWFDENKMQIMSGVLQGTDEDTYLVRVGFKKGALAAWESDDPDIYDRAPVTVTYVISADAKIADKFILADASANRPFKFLYGDFTDVGDIGEYKYDASKPAYVVRLAFGDTLADLLAQFENGAEIKAFTAGGAPIADLSTPLATGMILRLTDGETVLNQLTLSVLGDINGDGKITVADKTQLNARVLGKLVLDGAKLLSCDINGDGKITVADKTQLNAHILGKLNIFAALYLKTATVNMSSPVKLSLPSAEDTANGNTGGEAVLQTADAAETEIENQTGCVTDENTPAQTTPFDKIDAVCVQEKRYGICGRKEKVL